MINRMPLSSVLAAKLKRAEELRQQRQEEADGLGRFFQRLCAKMGDYALPDLFVLAFILLLAFGGCAFAANDGGMSSSSSRPFMGSFIFLIGFIFSILAYYITDQPTNGWVTITSAACVWLIAFIFIGQAVSLILTGRWGDPRDLASLDRLTENILVFPVVVSELKLGDVKQQVFGANLVEGRR